MAREIMDRENGLFKPVFMLWLICAIVLTVAGWHQITTRSGWDPDDQLRLVQLRDFLSGQGWFDTTQYRMNPPDGAPMHWSRLVELPLALVVLTMAPVFGQAYAEMIAGAAIPLFGLGLLMLLLAQIAYRLGGQKAAIIAALMAVLAPSILQQFLPMRIDHHGWQALLAVLALWTLFRDAKKSNGIILGLALAIWLHISLEGLPLTAAFFLLLGWRWVIEKAHGERLLYTVASFAGATTLLFLGTQAKGLWAATYCDTVSPPHVAAIGLAAMIMVPAIILKPSKRRWRLLAATVAGLLALIAMLVSAPQCSGGAFATLDPLVREYWYQHILEGMPVWKQGWGSALPLMAALLCGLAVLVPLLRSVDNEKRSSIKLAGFFLCYSMLLSCFVFRTATVATAFAIPVIASWISILYERYRSADVSRQKMLLAPLMLFFLMPGSIVAQLVSVGNMIAPSNGAARQNNVRHSDKLCVSPPSVAKLATLPESTFLTTFDMAPTILMATPHKVLASSHHRNAKAMHDHIEIFRSPAEKARKFIAAHEIDYIAVCPQEAELKSYQHSDPNGLGAGLANGLQPEWLERLPDIGDGIRVWKVR